MSDDLHRRPDVECMKCGSELYLIADGICDDRQTVNLVVACDCKTWDYNGTIPDSWVETDSLGD